MFCVFDWQENSWGINFCGHSSVVCTIIVRFAKYASYCGLIFVDRGIPQNPRKFMHLEIFYTYSISKVYADKSFNVLLHIVSVTVNASKHKIINTDLQNAIAFFIYTK